MQLISRQEAKAQGLPRYYTGKPCLRGHVNERFVCNRRCWSCQIEREQTPERKTKAAAYDKTPERKAKKAAANAAWDAANKERVSAYKAAWYAANKERMAYAGAARYKANKERHKAYSKEWRAANPAARAAISAQYRAAKLERTPKWLTPADKAAIKKIYDDCAFVSRVTGEKHHVDHTLPLQGDTVSGLHVPLNLQILTATENVTKANKLLEQFE